jgi:6-phosphofructokinase
MGQIWPLTMGVWLVILSINPLEMILLQFMVTVPKRAHSVLCHIHRGGNPSSFDRKIATSMGNYAVEILMENKTGLKLGVRGEDLVTCPIAEAIKEHSELDLNYLKLLRKLSKMYFRISKIKFKFIFKMNLTILILKLK